MRSHDPADLLRDAADTAAHLLRRSEIARDNVAKVAAGLVNLTPEDVERRLAEAPLDMRDALSAFVTGRPIVKA